MPVEGKADEKNKGKYFYIKCNRGDKNEKGCRN
jgi:hypothetical protein